MKLSGLGKNTLYQFINVNIIKNFKLALSTEPRVNKNVIVNIVSTILDYFRKFSLYPKKIMTKIFKIQKQTF